MSTADLLDAADKSMKELFNVLDKTNKARRAELENLGKLLDQALDDDKDKPDRTGEP